jgi:A/G-specific adenine glycosylase
VKATAVQSLVKWFAANSRQLPWRAAIGLRRDPYAVLVSEAMLQQTQVSRVIERFPRFLARFPTVQSLADADEREVLAMWTGMGYYRRARNLHIAAKMIVERFGGKVPRSVSELRELPGVGRYTAGAVSSIAHGEQAPIVDGNVARVMLRIHGREVRSDDREIQPWLWERADELAAAGFRGPGAGIANEAIMELGATVCVPAPAKPRCGECPLAGVCEARKMGATQRIPLAKAATVKRVVYCATVVVRDARGRVLLEQRGDGGMWAGLWQAPTVERTDRPPTRAEVARSLGMKAAELDSCGRFRHITTHRRVEFAVYAAMRRSSQSPVRGEWVDAGGVLALGVSSAQKRAIGLAAKR